MRCTLKIKRAEERDGGISVRISLACQDSLMFLISVCMLFVLHFCYSWPTVDENINESGQRFPEPLPEEVLHSY